MINKIKLLTDNIDKFKNHILVIVMLLVTLGSISLYATLITIAKTASTLLLTYSIVTSVIETRKTVLRTIKARMFVTIHRLFDK
jgi:hypothetical protein